MLVVFIHKLEVIKIEYVGDITMTSYTKRISIKNLVIDRRNRLFSISVDGAYATAVPIMMAQSAILHKLEPYQYLV